MGLSLVGMRGGFLVRLWRVMVWRLLIYMVELWLSLEIVVDAVCVVERTPEMYSRISIQSPELIVNHDQNSARDI